MGIGIDGLAVAEKDDNQQADNGRAYGDDVMHPDQAERNQQRQRGFRAVCGGTQSVQSKDGNAGDGSDVLGAFFARRQRPAKEQVLNA